MSRISSTFKKTHQEFSSPKSAFLTSVPRTRSPSPNSRRRQASSPSLRQSINQSVELKSLENDYIKNLQQQVYFLELEANYLREQASKATEMHPKMASEAERMLHKLKNLQTDVDSLNWEVKRKDDSLSFIHTEKEKALTQLEEEERMRQRERSLLTDEIYELKKERDRLSLENNRKASQIDYVATDKDKLQLELMNAESTITRLRNNLDEKNEQLRNANLMLEEKNRQVLEVESHSRQLEDRYIKNASILHDKTVSDLREEIRILQRKLSEAESRADGDRRLRTQVEHETTDILEDNSVLQQQVNDLERQLAREKELRENVDERRSRNLAELSLLTDKEKGLQYELRQMQNILRDEKNRSERLLDQIGSLKNTSASLEMTSSSATGRVYELEGKTTFLENENTQLRRDKELLVDHVAELQRQLSLKNTQLSSNKHHIKDLEQDISTYEHERIQDDMRQSEKWHEFESLADNMKSLSRSMARSTSPPRSPRSPRSSMRMSRKSGKGMYAL